MLLIWNLFATSYSLFIRNRLIRIREDMDDFYNLHVDVKTWRIGHCSFKASRPSWFWIILGIQTSMLVPHYIRIDDYLVIPISPFRQIWETCLLLQSRRGGAHSLPHMDLAVATEDAMMEGVHFYGQGWPWEDLKIEDEDLNPSYCFVGLFFVV